MRDMSTPAQLDALENRDLDVGFVRLPVSRPDLAASPVLRDRLVIALGPFTRGNPRGGLNALAREPFIVVSRAGLRPRQCYASAFSWRRGRDAGVNRGARARREALVREKILADWGSWVNFVHHRGFDQIHRADSHQPAATTPYRSHLPALTGRHGRPRGWPGSTKPYRVSPGPQTRRRGGARLSITGSRLGSHSVWTPIRPAPTMTGSRRAARNWSRVTSRSPGSGRLQGMTGKQPFEAFVSAHGGAGLRPLRAFLRDATVWKGEPR